VENIDRSPYSMQLLPTITAGVIAGRWLSSSFFLCTDSGSESKHTALLLTTLSLPVIFIGRLLLIATFDLLTYSFTQLEAEGQELNYYRHI
jgi:hypothetical protein